MAKLVFDDENKTLKFDEPAATTPTGLPALSSSATPSIDAAEPNAAPQPQPAPGAAPLPGMTPAPAPQLAGDLTPGSSAPAEPDINQNLVFGDPTLGIRPVNIDYLGFGREVLRQASTTVGLIKGAAIGAAAAGGPLDPPGALVGGVIGAALGYGLAKSSNDTLDRAIGDRPPITDVKEGFNEAVRDVDEGAKIEMMGHIIGVPIGKVLEFAAGPISGALVGGKEAMAQIIQKAKDFGMELSPAEVTKSKGLSLLENFLSNVPFAAGKFQKEQLAQLQALSAKRQSILDSNGGEKALEEAGLKMRNLIDDVTKDFRNFDEDNLARLKDRVLQKVGSPESYHDLIQPLEQANEKNISRMRDFKNQKYENLAQIMPDDLSGTPTELHAVASQALPELERALPELQDSSALSIVKGVLSKDTMSASELVANRAALNNWVAKNTNFGTGEMTNAARIGKQMIGAIDEDLGSLAESTGDQTLIDSFKLARQANADYKNYLNDPLVRKIASNQKPEAIVASVYTPGNDSEIQKFQEKFGPDFSDRAKKVFLSSLLGLNKVQGLEDVQPFTGDFIRNQMGKYGTTLKSILQPQEIRYLTRIADVVDGRQAMSDEIIKNPLLRSIMRSDRASTMVDLVVKPNDVGNVLAIKKYVGEDGMDQVRNGLLNKLLVKNQFGNFSPNKFSSEFGKYDERVLNEVFAPDVVKDLKDLSFMSSLSGGAEKVAGNPSGTSKNLITGMGIGYLVSHPIRGLAVVLGASQVTDLYLSAIGRRYLTQGFVLPVAAKIAPEIATKIMGLVYENSKRKDDLQKKQGE
jgi:hypothetical protein